MATVTVDVCEICTNSYNSGPRQSVTLPCGHDFCLSCLVRWKASGKRQCPTCRRNWVGFDVPHMPEMEALAVALHADLENDGDMDKKKGLFDLCEKHSMPYDYWVTGTTDFFCRKCAKENRHADIELIEEAIPQVKETLAAKITNAMEKIEHDLESLDEMHASFVRKRNCVLTFVKEAMALDENFKRKIEQVADFRSQVLNTAADMKKMQSKIDNIKNAADISLAGECKSTLERAVRPLTFPSSDLPQSLLCNIACSYVEESATVNPPSRASFVNSMLKGTSVSPLTQAAWAAPPSSKASSGDQLLPTTKNLPTPSTETVAAAKQLVKADRWTVNKDNCEVALLALAVKQPGVLALSATDDDRGALPVAAVCRAIKGCKVEARFLDTFYSADNSATDAARLEHLTANQSLRLTLFFGHLNQSAIAKLPYTITILGLAIGNATDAAAVSSLRPWRGLDFLNVSVSSRVAVKDLKPLPTVTFIKTLYFPFLSDADVASVRPAIEALAPELRIIALYFPKSQLTIAGARHLTLRLLGVTITGQVTVEASGTWRPGVEEKESIASELRSATGCKEVEWS